MSPSKKPESWNVLPSGDLSFRKSSLFVFATATRNEAVAARPFDIRLFGLRFKYFECRGCPVLSPSGLFLFGRSSRSVFAKINPLQPKGGPAPLSFIYFEFKFNIWKTCVPNAAQQPNFFSPAGVFSDQLETKPRCCGHYTVPNGRGSYHQHRQLGCRRTFPALVVSLHSSPATCPVVLLVSRSALEFTLE